MFKRFDGWEWETISEDEIHFDGQMSIKELARNWMENDETGDYAGRKITLEDAETLIGYMDDDTLNNLDETITPEKFMEAWNELI